MHLLRGIEDGGHYVVLPQGALYCRSRLPAHLQVWSRQPFHAPALALPTFRCAGARDPAALWLPRLSAGLRKTFHFHLEWQCLLLGCYWVPAPFLSPTAGCAPVWYGLGNPYPYPYPYAYR